ncbi:hypothetical protein BDM02DRAFT_3113754 [Thelephora ganbajun]|uniref:Uncharacterized protein n=1 Tax=Thelephora ganbajun TaxID=370292 RepID=A0ACB6ZJ86_THEGA|nr:hypothetical protein BDM02DRAFT_3113754 [Thelephora ganbajun]
MGVARLPSSCGGGLIGLQMSQRCFATPLRVTKVHHGIRSVRPSIVRQPHDEERYYESCAGKVIYQLDWFPDGRNASRDQIPLRGIQEVIGLKRARWTATRTGATSAGFSPRKI